MPVAARKAALEASKRERLSVAAWLAAAGAPPPKEVVDATYQSLQAALARVNRAFQG
jgi:hypothetical protein